MWNKQSFETRMELALKSELGPDTGETYFAQYVSARDYLIANVYSQIIATEPSLTDHSAKHIAHVLRNANQLIGDDNDLSSIELYFLGLIILFHDVGNLYGRIGHNKRISEVYNAVRKNDSKYKHERSIVIKAAESHCGFAQDGSKDTLKDVEISSNIDGYPIRLKELAAVLRLADELAEGPIRTSDFIQENGFIDPESAIHHKYGNITNIQIDRGNNRIAVTYNIDVKEDVTNFEEFKELLTYSFMRLIKLDDERKYTKHYSSFLSQFKKTTVTFNICSDGIPCEIGIEKMEFTDDITIPGENKIDENVIAKKIPLVDLDILGEKFFPKQSPLPIN